MHTGFAPVTSTVTEWHSNWAELMHQVLRKWEVPTLIRQANDLLSRQSLLLAGSYFLNIKSPKLFTGNSVHINHNNSPCPLPRVGKFSAATVRPYHQSQHPCKGLSNSVKTPLITCSGTFLSIVAKFTPLAGALPIEKQCGGGGI